MGNEIHLDKLSAVLGVMLKDTVFIINPARRTRNSLFDILEKLKIFIINDVLIYNSLS